MRTTDSRPATRPVTMLVLAAGVWLLVGWWILGYQGATRAVSADVVAGLVLTSLATMQLLSGASHLLSVLTVWTGLGVVLAPLALQYGYFEPVVPAFLNDLVVGVVVVGAGVVLARRTRRLDDVSR